MEGAKEINLTDPGVKSYNEMSLQNYKPTNLIMVLNEGYDIGKTKWVATVYLQL